MKKMKNSGIDWIGDIPDSWELKKIKYILKYRVMKNNPIQTTEILSLTAKQGVIPYNEKQGGGNKPKENITEYRLAFPGDIVMNSMNILSGAVGLSNYFGCVSPVYYMLRPINKLDDVRYYNYIFQTKIFQRSLFGLGNGILIKESSNGNLNTIRMRITMDKFGNLFIPVAPPQEQQTIADFLDKKCLEIDSLITDIKTQIEVLEEYKKTVITETVTKGLDKNVQMQYSGVELIGDIPVGWDVKPLKYLVKSELQYGANLSGVNYSSELPRYIRITDITLDNKLKDDNKVSLSLEDAQGYILSTNDILFARSGATVGKTLLVMSEYGNCAFAGYLIKANINDFNIPKYIFYYTLSNNYIEWKNSIFIQATIQNIGADKYNLLKITIPPIEEQEKIVQYLDEKCSHIDDTISYKLEQITTLEEYKKTIIFEYVTGKKEVNENE